MLWYNVYANISLLAVEKGISMQKIAYETELEIEELSNNDIGNNFKTFNLLNFFEKLAKKIGCSEYDFFRREAFVNKKACEILYNIGWGEFDTDNNNTYKETIFSYDDEWFSIYLSKIWDLKLSKYEYAMNIIWPALVIIKGNVESMPIDNYLPGNIEIFTETEGKLQEFIDSIIAYSEYRELFIQEKLINEVLLKEDLEILLSLTQNRLTKWEYKTLAICAETMLSIEFRQVRYYLHYSPKKDQLRCLYIERKGYPKICSIKNTPELQKMMDFVIENERTEENKGVKNLPICNIYPNSFLVKSNIFFCKTNQHKIEEICGIIKILTNEHKIILREIYAGRCTTCNIYFIFLSDYEKLIMEGKILCNVITLDKLEEIKSLQLFSGYKNESVIKLMGYNVQSNNKLSNTERQNILISIIEKELLNINDIVSFLEWLVQIHDNDEKYTNAIVKWEEDKEFIKNYKIADYRKTNINELIVKKRN